MMKRMPQRPVSGLSEDFAERLQQPGLFCHFSFTARRLHRMCCDTEQYRSVTEQENP